MLQGAKKGVGGAPHRATATMMHSTGPARWAKESKTTCAQPKRKMVSRQSSGSHRVIDSPELAAQLDMRRRHRRRPFVLLLFLLRNLRGLVLRQALVRRRLRRLDPDDLAEEAQLCAHDGDVAFGRLRRLLQQLLLQLFQRALADLKLELPAVLLWHLVLVFLLGCRLRRRASPVQRGLGRVQAVLVRIPETRTHV